MRIATFVLVALQVVLAIAVIVGALTTHSDPAGNAMASGFAFVAAIIAVLFALPALLIALKTRLQWLALTLAVLGTCVMGAFLTLLF